MQLWPLLVFSTLASPRTVGATLRSLSCFNFSLRFLSVRLFKRGFFFIKRLLVFVRWGKPERGGAPPEPPTQAQVACRFPVTPLFHRIAVVPGLFTYFVVVAPPT